MVASFSRLNIEDETTTFPDCLCYLYQSQPSLDSTMVRLDAYLLALRARHTQL